MPQLQHKPPRTWQSFTAKQASYDSLLIIHYMADTLTGYTRVNGGIYNGLYYKVIDACYMRF